MKIRRIDNLDILSHASHSTKQKTHYRTVSGINEQTKRVRLGTKLSSDISSSEMKMFGQKVEFRNQDKSQLVSEKDRLLISEQQRTCSLYSKLRGVYSKLSQVYRLNEQKLYNLLIKHITHQYYIYQRQLFCLAKSLHLNKPLPKIILHHPFLSKLCQQIDRLIEFVQTHYGQRCMKEVKIMEDNILLRENMIREYTGREKYKAITKAFYPKLITNEIDIVGEFKQIYLQTGRQLNKAQGEMFQKLRSSEARISEIFSTVRKQKEIDIFQGRKFTYVIR